MFMTSKNGRCCAGNHRSNVSERLLKLVQARSQHGYWRRCGALGGAVLTDGSTLGTTGGAAVGGVIGHQLENNPDV